jgi:Pentapeptide repeats (8 copies)
VETATIIAAIAVFAVAAGLAVWLIPRRQRARRERSGVSGKDLAELENSSRATLVQLLGGVALILTFVATWLQISDARDASEETLRLTAAQQEAERFTRAVEQLGSPRPELRLGGIYGLEQVARDSPSRRETVGQLMLAYLKTNHPFDPFREPKESSDLDVQIQIAASTDSSLCDRAAGAPLPDTQAALSVLLAIPRPSRPQLDFTAVDLTAVRANGADFTGAVLRRASLAGAKLSDAVFDDANITGEADLRGACFRDARFRDAYIGLVDAVAADFSGADFSGMRQPPVLSGAIGP